MATLNPDGSEETLPYLLEEPCPNLVLRYHFQLRAGAGGTGNDDCESAMRGVMVQKGRPSDAPTHLSTVTLGPFPSLLPLPKMIFARRFPPPRGYVCPLLITDRGMDGHK